MYVHKAKAAQTFVCLFVDDHTKQKDKKYKIQHNKMQLDNQNPIR